jgi:hypothetical protein
MKIKTIYFLTSVLIISSLPCFSDETGTITIIPTDEKIVTSCHLAIKIKTPSPTDIDRTPKVMVEISLLSADSIPISGQKIQLTATTGTFLCDATNSDDRSCFITDQNGKALVNLINIPYNLKIRVKALCDCGDYQVNATGNVLIYKKAIHNK